MPLILLDRAFAMNEAEFTLLESGYFKFHTHPAPGGYSGYVPVRLAYGEQGSIQFAIDLDVSEGSVGIAAVDSDLSIICERVTSYAGGLQKLRLRVGDVTRVAGLLLRNADHRGISSEGTLIEIATQPFFEPFMAIPKSTSSKVLSLPLRRRKLPIGGTERFPEIGGVQQIETKPVSIARSVVVIVDAWAEHECPGWQDRLEDNILNFLLPALTALRSVGMPIIYAPHDRAMHPALVPAADELVLNGVINAGDIARALQEAAAVQIIYMGYASNHCLMTRPASVIDMWRHGFGIIVVRDASIAVETRDTFAGERSHEVMMDFVEGSIGATVSVAEICSACAQLAESLPTYKEAISQ